MTHHERLMLDARAAHTRGAAFIHEYPSSDRALLLGYVLSPLDADLARLASDPDPSMWADIALAIHVTLISFLLDPERYGGSLR